MSCVYFYHLWSEKVILIFILLHLLILVKYVNKNLSSMTMACLKIILCLFSGSVGEGTGVSHQSYWSGQRKQQVRHRSLLYVYFCVIGEMFWCCWYIRRAVALYISTVNTIYSSNVYSKVCSCAVHQCSALKYNFPVYNVLVLYL